VGKPSEALGRGFASFQWKGPHGGVSKNSQLLFLDSLLA
jgi:hypothetical protein